MVLPTVRPCWSRARICYDRRGPWERDEFHLAAIAQNLKTLALRAPDCLYSASFA